MEVSKNFEVSRDRVYSNRRTQHAHARMLRDVTVRYGVKGTGNASGWQYWYRLFADDCQNLLPRSASEIVVVVTAAVVFAEQFASIG